MANRPHFVSVQNIVTVNESANNTETVMATLTGIIPEVASQAIKLTVNANVQLGASSTGGSVRIRRGSLTGTAIGLFWSMLNLTTAAGITAFSCSSEDTPGEGIFTYVVTFQGAGDTGVGGFVQSEFTARWD